MPSPPVRATTLHAFLQDHTEMRISEEATTLLVGLLTTTAENVAATATQAAAVGARTTILARDIQSAWDALLEASGAPLATTSAAALHAAITGVPNDSLSELIALLQENL
jgi:histone H3/H4